MTLHLRDYLGESYRLILKKLPKRLQAEVAARARQRKLMIETFRDRIAQPFSCPVHVATIIPGFTLPGRAVDERPVEIGLLPLRTGKI